LSSLGLVVVDDSIAGMALELAGQLPGALGPELRQVAMPGPDVVLLLQQESQKELHAHWICSSLSP
jgi:hypothetical protein